MDYVRIGLIGDFDPHVRSHVAIPRALRGATAGLFRATPVWIPTLAIKHPTLRILDECDGLWAVPGSPYQSGSGAMAAIQLAREHRIPFLGTCGGFLHAILEIFHDVLGLADAGSEEADPQTTMPVISRAAQPLVGITEKVTILPDTRLSQTYRRHESVEEYHCYSEFNRKFMPMLAGAGVEVSAINAQEEIRAIELRAHPFFVATLFQPELAALREEDHPVIQAFVTACHERQTSAAQH